MVSENRTALSSPPARHSLSQDFVNEFKRERVALTVSEVAHEVGLAKLTVALVAKRAKMARKTFYDLFSNRETAIRYGIGVGNRKLRGAIDEVAGRADGRREQTTKAIDALLAAVAAEPYLAELCLVHGRGTEGGDVPFDQQLVQTLAGVVRPPRGNTSEPGPRTRTEELVAYGILSVIAERLWREGAEGLGELGPELATVALLPFEPGQDRPLMGTVHHPR